MNHLISLRAEFLKIKRTSLIYFAILAATFVPLLMLFDNLDGTPNEDLKRGDPIEGFYAEGWMYMVFLILPIFIVLITTLLLQIEHKNNAWKQVLASPQRFHIILLSKFIVLQAFIILMLVAYNALMLAAAWLIDLTYPDFEVFNYLNSWDLLLRVNARTYFAALGVSGIQFWLSLRYRNFGASLGIGLLGIMSPLLVFEFGFESFLAKFPYALSILVNIPRFNLMSVSIQWFSVAYMVAFFTLAFVEFNWKKVKS